MLNRRKFLKAGAAGTAVAAAPAALLPNVALALGQVPACQAPNPLLTFADQQFAAIGFKAALPNPLDPAYIYTPIGINHQLQPKFRLEISATTHQTGLVDPATCSPLSTPVWAYGAPGQPPVYPGRTFLAFENRKGFGAYEVTYVNKLVDANGLPLQSYLPVDTTLDWANPGAIGGLVPVPLVAHLHGGDVLTPQDGGPDAWGTPAADANAGTIVCDELAEPPLVFPDCDRGATTQQGRLYSKPYTYDNTQEAGHLWYHDHALGVTRTNVYMGLAGNYFIRDLNELLLMAQNKLPAWPYEVPLAIQDRNFKSDGTLVYPSDPRDYPAPPEDVTPQELEAFFAALETATPTTHFPEFFGDIMLVNGKAWPKLDVEPRQYRFRVLNGSDSRVYTMKFSVADAAGNPTATLVPFFVIGNELGLLNRPASPAYVDPRNPAAGSRPNVLAVAPGERYDIVVGFQGRADQKIIMTNDANAPFPDNVEGLSSVQQIMRFDVVKPLNRLRPRTTLTATTNLRPNGALPAPTPVSDTVRRRGIVLVEGTDRLGRLMTLMGPVGLTVNENGTNVEGTLTYKDPITELPKLGSTEIWEFYNTTVDAHPVHMHLVDFRILDRQKFNADVSLTPKEMQDGITGGTLDLSLLQFTGDPVTPAAEEAGKKDTATMYPGTVTRLLVTFKRPGEYVYHCHILSHEDHEMMRPYKVVP